jgi:hypothetical protein
MVECFADLEIPAHRSIETVRLRDSAELGGVERQIVVCKGRAIKVGTLWIYVGSTGINPEVRFAQRRTGYKSCKYVKQFGERLRLDLVPKYKVVFKNSVEAQAAEVRLAVRMRKRGGLAKLMGVICNLSGSPRVNGCP